MIRLMEPTPLKLSDGDMLEAVKTAMRIGELLRMLRKDRGRWLFCRAYKPRS